MTCVGILMALHLFRKSDDLHLLSAYESGEVALRRCVAATDKTIEGIGWERLWITKLYVESGVFEPNNRINTILIY